MERYNKTLFLSLQLYITDNQRNRNISVQPLAYEYHYQAPRSTTEITFSLVFSSHPPGSTTIDSPKGMLSDADNATSPIFLRQRVLTTFVANVTGTFEQEQARYNRYFDKKVSSLPALEICQIFYLNRPPLNKLSADHKTIARYNKLMPRTTRPFKVLVVRN